MGPREAARPVTIRLLKNAEVSGTVRFPDGKPAAGISVLMHIGRTEHDRHQDRRRRALPVAPLTAQIDIVARRGSQLGRRQSYGRAAGRTDRRSDHVDFVSFAAPGSTDGSRSAGLRDGRSRPVTLVELGDRPAEDAAKSPPGEGYRTLWAPVDEKGNYEFRVGPGRFHLRMPYSMADGGKVEIKVTDQPELVYDDIAVWRATDAHQRTRRQCRRRKSRSPGQSYTAS